MLEGMYRKCGRKEVLAGKKFDLNVVLVYNTVAIIEFHGYKEKIFSTI